MTNNLTYDEIVNSYEFKLTEKILKREYPWIKGISINESDLDKYALLFLDITIDPYELAKENDWKILWYNVSKIRDNESFTSPYLSTIYDVSYEEQKDISQEIESLMQDVKKSPAVPIDLKLPSDRKFVIGNYKVPTNVSRPPDSEEYEQKYVRRNYNS